MADYKRYGQIVNAECYLEDNSLVGIVKEFKIPKIEWKTVDIETLGQVAVYKAPTRVMEALTGSMTFQFIEPEIAAQVYNPAKALRFQLHQYVDVNGPDGFDLENSYTLITLVSLRFFGAEFGGTKLGDLEEQETEFTCHRLLQRVHDSDKTLLEVDVFANTVRNSSGEFWRR
ncbi:putative phage major tail tube protein [Roseibium sp. TrichSKD4]|uniref:phage major tail tube protein n=1 Tax=Roseibium sp. TrichSKD4 TaxID=744980 RepID=UPI0001E569C1|nr:phage major tail tube protein [Roseibium sp. TrichSKD4]EFO32500.1 putative phage major tail tube protein [Roseibium sp. TrichSKD4]